MDVELYPITYWLVGFFGTIFVVGVVTNAAVAFASYHDSWVYSIAFFSQKWAYSQRFKFDLSIWEDCATLATFLLLSPPLPIVFISQVLLVVLNVAGNLFILVVCLGHIVLIYAFATGNLLMKSTTCVWIEVRSYSAIFSVFSSIIWWTASIWIWSCEFMLFFVNTICELYGQKRIKSQNKVSIVSHAFPG